MNKVCGTTKFSPAVDTFYEWELENFPQFVQFFGEDGVESPEFKIVSSHNKQHSVKISVRVDPKSKMGFKVDGVKKSNKDFVLIEVKVLASPSIDLKLVGMLELVLDDGNTILGHLDRWDASNKCWPFIHGSSMIVEVSHYTNKRDAFCVPKDYPNLQMKVQLISPGPLASTIMTLPSTTKVADNSAQLLSDIKALLTNDNGSADFNIVCEDQIFPCHETILRARSSVLDRMFQQKMKESISRKLIIDDLKKETIGHFLEFLYTGDLTGTVNNLSELIYAADKYFIAGLLELCYTKIPDVDEKIVDILIVAERHNLVDLAKVVMERFASSNLPEVDVKILDILLIARLASRCKISAF